MPRRQKDDFTAGLETILNNPQASFLKNPAVFREIQQQSGMSVGAMIKQLGRGSKRQKPAEPTDAEKSKARMDKMEEASEKK